MARKSDNPSLLSGDQNETSEQITYIPGDGDPVSTKWHGIVFHAHVPKLISKPELIEAAKANRFFKVGEYSPDQDKAPPPFFTGDPKTSDQYRAHVVAWLNKLSAAPSSPHTIEEMVKTWVAEQHLRESCEVGSEDYSFIGAQFLPKMHEFAKQAEMSDTQLADLWRRYGVFQLPF